MPVTPNKGLLYPAPGAFTDAQDSYNLAKGVDTQMRNYIAQLLAGAAPTAFLARTTGAGSNQSSSGLILPGSSSVEYDPYLMDTGSLGWSQPTTESLSYYLVGADLLMTIVSGTPTVGNNLVGQISATTTDPFSGITSNLVYYKSDFESNNAGEQIQVMAVVKMYRGSVSYGVQFTNLGGTAVYNIAAGSRSWALRLGTVPS